MRIQTLLASPYPDANVREVLQFWLAYLVEHPAKNLASRSLGCLDAWQHVADDIRRGFRTAQTITTNLTVVEERAYFARAAARQEERLAPFLRDPGLLPKRPPKSPSND